MIWLNKGNIPYVPIIGLLMLIVSTICFVFPQIFDADYDSIGLDEKVDSRIRYSALALSIGMLLLFYRKFTLQNDGLIFVKCLLVIDLGYFSTRALSMLIHGFSSSVQRTWLIFELMIAICLAIIIKLKKASPRAETLREAVIFHGIY